MATAWLNGAAAALARPDLVVLIRHGHKDQPDPEAVQHNYNLSDAGFVQALQLSVLVPACLLKGRPLHLGAYGFDASTGKNARSYQTLVPLAVSSGRNIELFADAPDHSTTIGRRLRNDSRLTGSVLLLAWEHRRLPDLARGLGWDAMPSVDDADFDQLWLLRYDADAEAPGVEVLSQQALRASPCFRRGRHRSGPLVRAVSRWIQELGATPRR